MSDTSQVTAQQLLAAIQAGIPGGGASAAKRNLVGVPNDYPGKGIITRPYGPLASGYVPYSDVVQPYYDESDVWAPQAKGAEVIAAHQKALVRAGLLTGTYRFGVWDEPSREAYAKALGTANAARVPVEKAIEMYANSPVKTDAAAKPLVKRVPSGDELRNTFKTVAQATLGRYADEPTIQRMVAGYQKAVADEQQAEFEAEQSGMGGTVKQAPTAASYAEQELRKADPKGAAANRALELGNKFMDAFGSGTF